MSQPARARLYTPILVLRTSTQRRGPAIDILRRYLQPGIARRFLQ
jgi:hypothetical protein